MLREADLNLPVIEAKYPIGPVPPISEGEVPPPFVLWPVNPTLGLFLLTTPNREDGIAVDLRQRNTGLRRNYVDVIIRNALLAADLSVLPEDQTTIIAYRYGLIHGQIKPQKEVGDMLGLNRADMSRKERDALRALGLLEIKDTMNSLNLWSVISVGDQTAGQEETLALVTQVQSGGQELLAAFYSDTYASVYGYIAYRIGHPQDAEDVVSEVYARFFQAIQRGQYKVYQVPVEVFLFQIARNEVISHTRRQRVQQKGIPLSELIADPNFPEGMGQIDEDMDRGIVLAEVKAAMATLSPGKRNVLLSRFGAGLNVEETAVALGKSIGSVKVLQFQAIAELQALLGIQSEKTDIRKNKSSMKILRALVASKEVSPEEIAALLVILTGSVSTYISQMRKRYDISVQSEGTGRTARYYLETEDREKYKKTFEF